LKKPVLEKKTNAQNTVKVHIHIFVFACLRE